MTQRFTSIATPAARQADAGPSMPAFTLPPPITSDARLSLTRLPIGTDSRVHWQHFSARRLDGHASQHDLVALEEAAEMLMEDVQRHAQDCASHSIGLASSLYTGTLWCPVRGVRQRQTVVSQEQTDETRGDEPRKVSESAIVDLWIFHIGKSESSQLEDAGSASNLLNTRTDGASEHLSRAGVSLQQGSCLLSGLYDARWAAKADDVSALLPVGEVRDMLPRFLEALQEYFLMKWVWLRAHEAREADRKVSTTTDVEARRSSKDGVFDAVKAEVDDEEEGALGDEQELVAHRGRKRKAGLQFWTEGSSAHRVYPISRFGQGVALYDGRSDSSPLENAEPGVPSHMALRCFADEQGHLFLETWPRKPPTSRYVTRQDDEGQALLLGPLGVTARLVRHLGALHVHDMTVADEQKLRQPHDALFRMLRLRGVDTAFLSDDWTLCARGDHQFVWPTQLCLLHVPHRSGPRADRPSLLDSTLTDVAAKARNFVRETLGLKPSPDLSKAEDVDDSDVEDVQDDDVFQDFSEDEGTSALQDPFNRHDNAVKEEPADQPQQPKVDPTGGDHDARLANEQLRQPDTDTQRNSIADVNGNVQQREEELDLWGSFGFGDQDDTHMEPAPRSRDGLEDAGFGLVTEDDFSFFDDAAAVFNAFADEEMSDVHPDMVEQHDHFAADKPTAPMTRGQDTDGSSGAPSTSMDPPSLPGFTPGSLSASSPAVGGLSAKTPRTPYSPSQDLADATITIEGEHGQLESNMYGSHFHPPASQTLPSLDHAAMAPQDIRLFNAKDRQAWTMRGRRDINSKYEEGKFAMPLMPARRKQNEEDSGEQDQFAIPPRSRVGHRAGQSARRFSASKHGFVLNAATAQKGRLNLLRADDEMSEATGDGTISERSSLMDDDDSDDDGSISSDGADEGSLALLKQRETQLISAASILREEGFELDRQRDGRDDHDGSAGHGAFGPIEWDDVARHLLDNPPLRNHIHRLTNVPQSMEVLSRVDSQHLFLPMRDAEQSTAVTVEEALSAIESKESTKDFTVQPLEPPNILVGCQSSVVSIAPTALPYWDKLALSAVSGPKTAVAFAIHLGDINEAMQKDILTWFTALEKAFASNGFGSHVVAEDGLLGLDSIRTRTVSQLLATISGDAERWSDTLDSLLSRFVEPLKAGKFVILYAIGMPQGRSLIWVFGRLERDLRALASSRFGVPEELIVIRPCPWEYIATVQSMSRSARYDIRRFAVSVYDSLQVPINASYNTAPHLPQFQSSPIAVRYPTFTIAPNSFRDGPQAQFKLDWNTKLLNVLDHGTMLHVGFTLGKKAGSPVIVAIMDERAQGYTVTAWGRAGTIAHEVCQMWKVIADYSKRARTMWCIVVCKDEPICATEADAWSTCLKDRRLQDACALDVTLACVEHSRSLAVVLPVQGSASEAPRRSATEVPASTKLAGRYYDTSRVKYAIYPAYRMALPNPGPGRFKDSAMPILALRSSLTLTVPYGWNHSTAVQPVHADEEDDVHHRPVWPYNVPHHLWLHVLQVYSDERMPEREGSTPTSASSMNDGAMGVERRLERITKSFQELELIARERAMLSDDECSAHLPWHLAVLQSFKHAIPVALFKP